MSGTKHGMFTVVDVTDVLDRGTGGGGTCKCSRGYIVDELLTGITHSEMCLFLAKATETLT